MIGVLSPLYTTSVGMILLAWQPAAEREACLRKVSLQPCTQKTIRSALGITLPESRFDELRQRAMLQALRSTGAAIADAVATVALK